MPTKRPIPVLVLHQRPVRSRSKKVISGPCARIATPEELLEVAKSYHRTGMPLEAQFLEMLADKYAHIDASALEQKNKALR